MRKRLLTLLASALISISAAHADIARGPATGVCEREVARAAEMYDVPIAILYAVALTETGYKGSLQPYALNIEGKDYVAKTLPDALRAFREAQSRGAKLIDIGCMQINQYFHGENFASVADMFDPHRNVEYAARFLRDLHDRHETWTMAVARYHAGPNNDPAQKVYVCRVIANLVATGYGKWTPNAATFCRD